MHAKTAPALAVVALAALMPAAMASAATGPSADPIPAAGAPQNGGTPAGRPATIERSGGVAGPEVEHAAAHAAQQTAQEQPPQVETTPTDTTPTSNMPAAPGTTETAPGNATPVPAGASAGAGSAGGGGGLPHTGLELGALAAVGLGLLLAGLALRRRPVSG